MNKSGLESLSILLADDDAQIAKIVQSSLLAMGCGQVHHVRNSTDAMQYISRNTVNILITEWLLTPMDGIEMVRHLRIDKNSPRRGLPIIMLTGRGETVDIAMARDVGITAFLEKPFTVQSLYEHIAELIDHPRSFVLSEHFVGPDRRQRSASGGGISERRNIQPKEITKSGTDLPAPTETPVLVLPDYEMKRAIGASESLSAVITPEMLESAQKNLEKLENESLRWVLGDLNILEQSFFLLQRGPENTSALNHMQNAAMSIKSRSGTFGFPIPSEIARRLYLFLSTDYIPMRKAHNILVQQSIGSLKIVFASDPKGTKGLAQRLMDELEQMTKLS